MAIAHSRVQQSAAVGVLTAILCGAIISLMNGSPLGTFGVTQNWMVFSAVSTGVVIAVMYYTSIDKLVS